jgi:hypothetical protein
MPRSKIEPSPCTAARLVAKPDELVKRIPDWPQTVADRIEQGRFIASDKLIDVSWKTLDTHWEEFRVNHEEDPGFQVTDDAYGVVIEEHVNATARLEALRPKMEVSSPATQLIKDTPRETPLHPCCFHEWTFPRSQDCTLSGKHSETHSMV